MANLTQEAADAAINFCAFAWKYWKVTAKEGGRKPFEPNAAQRMIDARRVESRQKRKQFRAKVLKYRQAGISTYCSGVMQYLPQTMAGCVSLSIADKQDLPEQWLRRAKRWYAETPKAMAPHLAASNAIELYYDLIDSRYFIGSAEGKTPGMGHTIRGLHCSEISNWGNPTKVFDDLLPAIPKNDPAVVVIYESTGEVEGDWWHKAWYASQRHDDDFEAIFLPWSLQEEYRMPADDILDLVPEEHDLMRLFKLDREQIAWRRWTIRNEFQCDPDRFRVKYPLTPEEAFMGIGTGAVPREVIRYHASTVRPPMGRFRLVDIGDNRVKAVEHHGSGPCWEIWYMPDDQSDYCVGGDVMEGKRADQSNERSEQDFSAAMVLNRRRLRFDAQYHGQIPPDEFGREMLKAAKFYNMAWTTPEVNNAGWSTLTAMKGYKRLFLREGAQDEVEDHELNAYGWKTGQENRDWLIDHYFWSCRPDPVDRFANKLIVLSQGLLDEEKSFVWNGNGKREHVSGCHDDLMFAAFIANMLHTRTPRTWTPPVSRYELVTSAKPGHTQAGGIDDLDDDAGPDDEST